MSTFLLTQTPTSQNMYLYPDGDSSNDLTPYGETNNYECVDENKDVPDTTTYVYTSSDSAVSDFYTLEEPSTTTGTINSVTVYARAKSHIYNQDSTGIYKLVINDGFGHIRKSDNNNVVSNYGLFYKTWLSNPTDSTSWTWTDIQNLICGVECSSPSTVVGTLNSVFRPNAEGDKTDAGVYGVAHNWDAVNDTTPDDMSTYVYIGTDPAHQYDLYALPNHTTETGDINYVAVFTRVRIHDESYGSQQHSINIKTGGTVYTEYKVHSSTEWAYKSHTWYLNPSDSAAWEWSDIDALQIGGGLHAGSEPLFKITQVYAVVNYNAPKQNPEIRTTQCYIRVNYTPSSVSANLNLPDDYEFNNSREIKKKNFWNDTRAVYDLRRKNKTLSMNGTEYLSSATSTLLTIKNMYENGSSITISGFTDDNVNTSWIIKHFDYNRDSSNPNLYKWVMDCEKA